MINAIVNHYTINTLRYLKERHMYVSFSDMTESQFLRSVSLSLFTRVCRESLAIRIQRNNTSKCHEGKRQRLLGFHKYVRKTTLVRP